MQSGDRKMARNCRVGRLRISLSEYLKRVIGFAFWSGLSSPKQANQVCHPAVQISGRMKSGSEVVENAFSKFNSGFKEPAYLQKCCYYRVPQSPFAPGALKPEMALQRHGDVANRYCGIRIVEKSSGCKTDYLRCQLPVTFPLSKRLLPRLLSSLKAKGKLSCACLQQIAGSVIERNAGSCVWAIVNSCGSPIGVFPAVQRDLK